MTENGMMAVAANDLPATKTIPVSDEALLNCGLHARVREAVRQIWQPEDSWLGYTHHPRPCSGLVLICADIEMVYTFAGGEVRAHMGDVVYVPSGMQYRVSFRGSTPDSHLDSYTVNFELFDREGCRILLSDTIRILAGDPQNRRYAPLAAELYEAYCLEKIGASRNALKLEAIFLYLLDRLLTDVRGRTDCDYPIRRGVRALTAEWDRNRPIAVYAEMCGVSESYFYLLFKRSLGVSPVEYRNRIRVQNACSLLESTSMSVEEIAAAVGFETAFYFSRIFKKLLGIPPRRYREGRREGRE